VRTAAEHCGVSPTTIQKWRKRETAADARLGPKQVRSTALTPEEEAIIVAFRKASAPAAGRLPRWPAAHDPASYTLEPTPLFGTACPLCGHPL
jgi:transposase